MNERFLSQLAISIMPLLEEIIDIMGQKDMSPKTKLVCIRLALINGEIDLKKALALSAQNLFCSTSNMEFKAGRVQECHWPDKSNITICYFLN